MNTLLATNILLAVIVACIVALTVAGLIALAHVISISRKVKRIVREFEGDVVRARSVLVAIGENISEKIFGKKKR